MITPRFLYPSLFAFAVLAFTLAIVHLVSFAFSCVALASSPRAQPAWSSLTSAAVLACAGLLLLAVIDIRKRLEDRR